MQQLYIKIDNKFYRLISSEEQAQKENVCLSALRVRRLRKKSSTQNDEVFIKKGWYKISLNDESE